MVTYKGFVKSILSMVTVIGAFILAYVFGPVLGEWIEKEYVNDYVASYTYEAVVNSVVKKDNNYDASVLLESVHEEFSEFLAHCGVEIDDIITSISPTMTVTEDELITLSESIAQPISRTIAMASGVIVTFFAALISISLIGLILKLVIKLPIIKSIDTILGMILGVLEGIVIVWITCVIIGVSVEHGFLCSANTDFLNSIANGSRLLNYFCELSPIDFINIRVE